MKRLYLSFILGFVSSLLHAQVYGNEWIVYSQKYLKIKVVSDRIYRIDSTVLASGVAATGASLAAIDPRNFQLFHNGEEQYIWVKGDSDGVFNNGDVIEFYGEHNSGVMDSSLYGGVSSQLNPYTSLFNDTGVYFLTWNSSLTNRRYSIETDTAFSSYHQADYFINEQVFSSSAEYLPGEMDQIGITDADYIPSEGYYNTSINYGQSQPIPFDTYYAYPAGPDAELRFKVGTHSNDWATGNDNEITATFASTSFDTIYDGFSIWSKIIDSIPVSTLNASSTTLTISSLNPNGSASSGRAALAWASLRYPHTFNMESRQMFHGFLPDDTITSASHVLFTVLGGTPPFICYDMFNHSRIDLLPGGGLNGVMDNGNGTPKEFVVISDAYILPVSSLIPVNGTGTFVDYSTMATDSAFILVTNSTLWNAALIYRNYRMTTGHHVVMANVQDLYDQFAWGIGGDPLSIRNFCNYLLNNYPTAPKNLFLVGKSLSPELQRQGSYYPISLVPTMGYPPSDNNLTAGLNGTGWEPAIPTGRIAAYDSAEVIMYLNKVIAYESNAPAEWMKYVLHFGGGTDSGEQQQFAAYLSNYADTISDTLFGGHVLTYLKTSNAPIQINQSDSLRDRINAGVSIMTFFGHASGTSFDQSIDDPSTYNNAGKYPLIIANSCYAGNIHDVSLSSSETFTFIDQKGTIGYVASVGIGLAGYLNEYSGRLYQSIGKINYGRSIGESIQWTVRNVQAEVPNNILLESTVKEMTFQGDPAIVINSFPDPDYAITNADVWFDQESQPDSVYVFASIANLGKAIDTTFIVELRRTFPNGDTEYYYQTMNAPHFRDTLMFRLPVDQHRGIGLNHIRVDVDHFHSIQEMQETNNTTSPDVDLLIHGSAIIPVYPYEFAVIPSDTITLKACTVNPLEPIKTYRFEMDTTDLFNSPFKQTHVVTVAGGVVCWQPNLMPFSVNTDSVVYFWRVSPDSLTPADNFNWRLSSFQAIQNQVGWGQDHIYQFTNDAYQYVFLNRAQRRFDFVNDINNISVKNGIYFSAVPWNESWYKINQSTKHIFSCTAGFGGEGFSIAVIDPVSCKERTYHDTLVGQEPGGYWDCVGANQVLHAFDFFDTDNANQDLAANFIVDSIPNGSRVLIYSQDYPWYSRIAYNPNLQNAFVSIGCDTIGTSLVPDTCAFIAWGIKGVPGSATEVVGQQISSILTLNDTMVTNWYRGIIQSPMIGPAAQWGSFHWQQHTAELPDHDSVYVDIYGFNTNNVRTFITRIPETITDVFNLNTIVDAALFPYIQLVAHMRDDTAHTPAQLDRWHVLYTPVPDVAVNPPLHFTFHSDTLQEGDLAQMVVAVQNLTPWIFPDTMLYTYWIVDENHNTHTLPSKVRPGPFIGYAWLNDTISFNTTNYSGENELWMEVNPLGHPQTQYEQYHFNNVIMVPFMVSSDRINPLLDVTFDGVHIMDGDIVSGKPQILVTLKDENQFLALNDTSDFTLFLRTPSQQQAQIIYFSDPRLQFTPAQLPNNSCRILFTPTCPEDGTYDLLVQAKDRSDNQSGLLDYEITFEVINHPSITNTLNYPNPFSTSTRFVFTLTGNEVPEIFTVQIMTITGKVVREIDRNEIGEIHIGRNITSYAWDGKDEYGDQLANGVYLYRIITRLDGQAVDHRESGADPYITQGWGKMYLMR